MGHRLLMSPTCNPCLKKNMNMCSNHAIQVFKVEDELSEEEYEHVVFMLGVLSAECSSVSGFQY